MGPIQELARDIGAEERTLRRAAAQGTLRSHRPGPRRLRLAPGEREYLRVHWDLLAELRKSLRTRRDVRLAVLYGSLARGDEDAGSDLDLLVSLSGERPFVALEMTNRLRHVSARRLDIAFLERVEGAPLLLDRILDEGRVLIDRDRRWPALRKRRRAIRARARRGYRKDMESAAQAIAELTR